MRFRRHIRQYWPITIVTGALVLALPFLVQNNERRMSFNMQHDIGVLAQFDDFPSAPVSAAKSGYVRPVSQLPLYGFDQVSLHTPMFKSWWSGKSAATKLQELNANVVVLDQVWRDPKKFHEIATSFRNSGIKIIVQVTEDSDWVDVQETSARARTYVLNTFASGRASKVLAEARNQGVGRIADFLLIGGNPMNYATQQQRQKMYEAIKLFFPNVPVIFRYGSELEKAEAAQANVNVHPMGSTWADYRFGHGECDIALVSLKLGDPALMSASVDFAGLNNLSAEPHASGMKSILERLNELVSIIKSRQHEVAVVISANLADEQMLSTSKAAMWAPQEIDQFVTAMMTSQAVDGLVFKGLGNYAYDFGYPAFKQQRLAIKNAAPSDLSRGREPASEPIGLRDELSL